MEENKPITRIDMEVMPGGGIELRNYFEGWREDQGYWDSIDFRDGSSLSALIRELHHSGYAIGVFNYKEARALRGEITRIDFNRRSLGWVISKYPYGWTAKIRPLTRENKGTDFDITNALTWLQKHHWTTVEWEGGARAWKGKKRPVRNREEIQKLRRLSNESHNADGFWHFDLAYYF